MMDEERNERDEQVAAAEETRLRRGIRIAQHTRLYVSLIVVVLTMLYLILLIARNTRHVRVDYVFGSGDARVVWLIVLSALTGWVLGLATSYLLRRRTRRLG